MGDEKRDDVPDFKPDVPMTGLVVRTAEETKTLALKISGRAVPNQARFHCTMCGFDKTLEFTAEEISAIPTGDVRDWPDFGGKCPTDQGGCGSPTIIARDRLADVDFVPAMEQVRQQRREDVQDATRTAVKTLKEELLGGISPGSIFDMSKDAPPGKKKEGDLPDLKDVDVEGLEPRKPDEG